MITSVRSRKFSENGEDKMLQVETFFFVGVGEAVWVEACSKLVVTGKDVYGCCACGSVQPQYDKLSPPDVPQI